VNVLKRSARKLDAIQQRHTAPAFVLGVVKKYGDDNAGDLAVQLTFAMFVTIFPLMLLLLTILEVVLAGDPSARARVLGSVFGQFPIVGQQFAHNIHGLRRATVFGLVVGALGLAYGSTGLAQAGLYAMAQIWDVPGMARPGYLARMVRSGMFLVLLGFGVALTTAMSSFGTFGRHNVLLGYLAEAGAAVVNIVLCFGVFRVLTPKQAPTRALWPGAVVGGIAWTVLQAVGGYVVGHDLKGASALYGMFGLVLGLAAWINIGARITLYTAEVNTVLHQHLWPRALVTPPLTDADQRSLALQAGEHQQRSDQQVTTSFTHRPMTQDEYRENGYELDEISDSETVTSPPGGRSS
jgi:uncharacterized BrkB/YihY/UPF0761 family membrane protein